MGKHRACHPLCVPQRVTGPAQGGGTAGPCSQLQSLCPGVRTIQPPGVSEPSLGDSPDLRRCLGWMWPAKVPSNPAFKGCVKRKVCVRAGVGGWSFPLNPLKNRNWTVRHRGKSFPTHCPGTRFASSASLGMWAVLEGLPIPSDPRGNTGNGSTSLLSPGSPRNRRCPFPSFSHWLVEPWPSGYELEVSGPRHPGATPEPPWLTP